MDVMMKEVLGIQHRGSSIQHQPAKCTHLSIPTMPAEKILWNVRVNNGPVRTKYMLSCMDREKILG